MSYSIEDRDLNIEPPGAVRGAAGEAGAGAEVRAERTAGTPAGETGLEARQGSRAGRRMSGGRGVTPSFRNSPGCPLTPGWLSRPPGSKHTRLVIIALFSLSAINISTARATQVTRVRCLRQLQEPSLQDIPASILKVDIIRARDTPSSTIENKVTHLSPPLKISRV